MCKVEVFIGLGSNLHEPITQLSKAISAISYIKDAELTNVSGFYENPPLGGVSQPPFVNAVARLETRLKPPLEPQQEIPLESHLTLRLKSRWLQLW